MFFFLIVIKLFSFRCEVEEPESVLHQPSLQSVIECAICGEAWRLVDLYQGGFKVLVKDHIKAKDLEAQLILEVIWLALPISVIQRMLTCNYGFDDQIFNISFQLFNWESSFFKRFVDLFQTPLVAWSLAAAASRSTIHVLILNVFVAMFIYTIVCKMLIKVFEVALFGTFILMCSEASNSIIEEIYSQRMDTVKQDVKSQVKFQAVNKEWVIYIFLSNYACVWICQAF